MPCRHKNTDTATQQTADGALTRTWCTDCDYLLSSSGTGTSTGRIVTRSHRRNETTGRMDQVADDTWDD